MILAWASPFNPPLRPHDALKHHFKPLKNRLYFPSTEGFKRTIPMKLLNKYMAIF